MWIKEHFYKVVIVLLFALVNNITQGQTEANKNKLRNKIDVAFGVGILHEWKVNPTGPFSLPNNGISSYLDLSYKLSTSWELHLIFNLDYLKEKNLNQDFWNGAYQISIGRRIYLNDKSNILLYSGISFIDEVTYKTTFAEKPDGSYLVRFFDINKYNSPFASIGTEYVSKINQKWKAGIRFNLYYDLINYGRTDFTGFLRFNLHSKKENLRYFK
uniref:hypothetical protein n=1 Tax=Roseivirga sp. TaxID=1964215 RepID=UPI0040485F6C